MVANSETTSISLEEKVKESRDLIRSSLLTANHPFVCLSGGIKSVVLLHLVRQETPRTWKVLYIKSGNEFEQAVFFVDKLRRLWQFELFTENATDADGGVALRALSCCKRPISNTFREAVQKYEIDCLLLGNTLENGRNVDTAGLPGGVARAPLASFTDRDILDYAKTRNLPLCSLYRQGYTQVDCARCTPSPRDRGSTSELAEHEQLIKDKLRKLGYL